MNTCANPSCLGNYDFNQIAKFAVMRFIEGYSTLALLAKAKTKREKEEIALVSLLDVEDNAIRNLNLCCAYDHQCETIDCRERLSDLIKSKMAEKF